MFSSKFPRHLASVNDLSIDQIEELFLHAEWLSEQSISQMRKLKQETVLGILFFQNSTRTRLSFETAMYRLGGSVIGFADISATRSGDFFQESFQDTVCIISQYADCLVIRHPDNYSAQLATTISNTSIINGGDGGNEHPTQALLDTWMLKKFLKTLKGKTIGLVGDPTCRDFRSLIFLLAKFQAGAIICMALPGTTLSSDEELALSVQNIACKFIDNVQSLLDHADAICMLPFILPSFNEKSVKPLEKKIILDEKYQLTIEKLLKKGTACPPIFHVGPRGEELPGTSDKFPAVHYYEQARHGVYLRAALINLITQ